MINAQFSTQTINEAVARGNVQSLFNAQSTIERVTITGTIPQTLNLPDIITFIEALPEAVKNLILAGIV